MDKWYKEKPLYMITELGKMKRIVSEWLEEIFGNAPIRIKSKGLRNAINFLVQTDKLKISIVVYVCELNCDKIGQYDHAQWFGDSAIPEDSPVIINRVWAVITDLQTKKRTQNDILLSTRYHDKYKLFNVMSSFKLQKYLGGIEPTSKLRTELEKNSIWRKIK